MTVTETLGRKVLAGGQLTKKEAMTLYGQPLEELCTMADTVRARFHAQAFSLCTIVNGKSGRCTENCRFCAQSAHYHTEAAVYPLCDQEEILAQAKRWQAQGVPRFGIVTAGRRLSGREVEEMCRTIRRVRRDGDFPLRFLWPFEGRGIPGTEGGGGGAGTQQPGDLPVLFSPGLHHPHL